MRKIIYLFILALIFVSCGNIDKPVRKSSLSNTDYRLFQGTSVWPLAKAAYINDLAAVNRILKDNPELANIPDSVYGGTMLMLAIERQNYELFKVLLDNGAVVNYHDKYNDASPLMAACGRTGGGDLRFASDLIEHGAFVNDTSSLIGSAMMMAVSYSTLPFVKLLYKNGADIYYRNGAGYNAIGFALLSGNYDAVLYLLENGADYTQPAIIIRDDNGNIIRQRSILETVRNGMPFILSPNYRTKQKIITFLENKGVEE